MNPKIILCLALVLSGIFASQRTYGYEEEIRINHANLKTDCSFLKIETVRINLTNDPVVFFTVIVIPKDKRQQSEHFEGHLEINDASDSHKIIGYTTVEAHKKANGIAFQFGIAVKYLETSEFRIEEQAGEFASPMGYYFNLKEFADDK
jgi:hypothetical protein